ncbi:MAG: sigma-E factor negative regulatory protein [Gammaproteobacteria bacterium]|nr:sigma-E factor negative regulatory protein [Gammaproteobacteria bacterium]
MSDKITEQLSAWMDGELIDAEKGLLIKRLEQNSELRGCWARYHTISDAVGRKLPLAMDRCFAARVMEAIGNEPDVKMAAGRSRSGSTLPFLKPAAGLMIAASVAAIAILSVQPVTRQVTSPAVQAPASAPKLYAQLTPSAARTPWNRPPPETASRLNNYLINHSEYAAMTSMQGMLPYVRIAGYEPRR